jgi:hypothetical protein
MESNGGRYNLRQRKGVRESGMNAFVRGKPKSVKHSDAKVVKKMKSSGTTETKKKVEAKLKVMNLGNLLEPTVKRETSE